MSLIDTCKVLSVCAVSRVEDVLDVLPTFDRPFSLPRPCRSGMRLSRVSKWRERREQLTDAWRVVCSLCVITGKVLTPLLQVAC